MTPASRILGSGVDAAFARAAAARDRFEPSFALEEMGRVVSVGPGIAEIAGLPGIGSEELLRCRGGLLAIAFDLAPQRIGAVLLGESAQLRAGDAVQRTGRVVDVPVGESLLGRVVDPLGRPADAKGPLRETARMPIERPAPAIMNRAPVTVPLHTGIKVIDALVPVGRGQRELILGDRQTGKTSIAVDTIINQRDQDVLCVYCAIGQRTSTVAKVVADLRAQGAMDHTVVVFAEGNDAPGLSYIAPYAATSIAEHFMERGRDVLIVYDDLTNHARAYRELSLLMRRPPGREAYPGDIFYLHSRLLERATHLAPEHGGGSLTALPIVETQAQDISAYMPTNLISITDGQIYVSPTLFGLGILPAVDVGRSVSRVGGKAQLPGHRAATAGLKLAYAQFEELETFTRFGARLDERTRGIIEHGRRIREFLKQGEHENLRLQDQIVLLLALGAGVFDEIPLERMRDAQQRVRGVAAVLGEALLQRVTAAARPSDSDRDSVLHAARAALLELRVSP